MRRRRWLAMLAAWFAPRAWTAEEGYPASGAVPAADAASAAEPTASAASASAGSSARTAASAAGSGRLALLIGDRKYPEPFDLPPIPKNVHDLKGVLEARGFDVTDAIDLDLAASRQAIERFIQRASASPPDATLFFYFSGHGAQIDALNLLLPAGQNPAAPRDDVRKGSLLLLDDIVRRVPERPQGLLVAVIDACRTSLKAGEDNAGLNQVKAPPGCLIAFSTGAGKPAIAPAVETQNTFYTASLVKILGTVSDETSFPDLFRLVKTDVFKVMSNFPIPLIRTLAQDPFIADESRNAPTVGLERAQRGQDESAAWDALAKLTWPSTVLAAAQAFLKDFPASHVAASATVVRDGAAAAMKIVQRPEIRLQRVAFQTRDDMDTAQVADLVRASRGDKDAAARMAQRYENYGGSAASMARYEGWLQYAAALGNGIASYELAVHYRREDQPLPAAQYEARARELGYTPPPALDNSRK